MREGSMGSTNKKKKKKKKQTADDHADDQLSKNSIHTFQSCGRRRTIFGLNGQHHFYSYNLPTFFRVNWMIKTTLKSDYFKTIKSRIK